MKKLTILIALFLFSFRLITNSQSLYCETAEPLCIGPEYTYPANISGFAQTGPDYGCLASQQAPSWFYMLVENSGDIMIYMYSTPLLDIDFICWGPFNDPYNPCVEGLTEYNIIDCSYSNSPSEYCDIQDCQAGEYYIMMVTNYSLDPTDITFLQTEGAGSMDCILIADFSASPVEGPAPLNVHFNDESVGNPTSYKWDFQNDGIYDNFNPNPTYTYNESGTYSVKLRIQNPTETDSIIRQNYISVLAPEIDIFPSALTIYESAPTLKEDNSITDTRDTLTLSNDGDYLLTVSSITTIDPWILLSGFPDTIFTIYPGESQIVIVDIDWPQLGGISDSGEVIISSSDLDEPIVTIPVTAVPLGMPDLIVQNEIIDTTTVKPGGDIFTNCDVFNQGNADALNSILKYYLSPDDLYDDDDLELATDTTGIIRVGQSIQVGDTLHIPSNTNPGPWYILFFADAYQQIEESNENNNVNYIGFMIDTTTAIPDPGIISNNNNLTLYPNPARDLLYLDYSSQKDTQPTEIALFNSTGTRMNISVAFSSTTQPGHSRLSLSLQGLPPGCYLLRIAIAGEVICRKVMVVR